MVRRLGDIYLGALADVKAGPGTDYRNERGKRPGEDKMAEAVDHLAHTMGEMPALLVPLMKGRPEGKSLFLQANMYGSVLQAVWSFFLALRARGLGSAWTTLSLLREAEMAEALGIPIAEYTQVGLFPIAYTIGTEFKPAYRDPLDTMLRYNAFS
jgi:nitroreductase